MRDLGTSRPVNPEKSEKSNTFPDAFLSFEQRHGGESDVSAAAFTRVFSPEHKISSCKQARDLVFVSGRE